MRHDIGVRVPLQAGLTGPMQPGHPQRSLGALRGHGVDVGTDADPG
jgi:hypothetical protein